MTDSPIPPMVERAARAIARWHAMQIMGDEIAWIFLQYDGPEAWVEEEWRQHEGEARAVIEAMRDMPAEIAEPAFLRAQLRDPGMWGFDALFRAAWGDVIDTALGTGAQ